jgi:hypothetical protein
MDTSHHEVLFSVARSSAHALGDRGALLCANGNRMVVEEGAAVMNLLGLLDGAHTLGEYAERLEAHGFDQRAPSSRETLEAMVATGLLQPVTPAPETGEQPAPRRIQTIGIITADRPRLLARCLDDAVNHLRHFDRRARIVVVDGSKQERNRRLNVSACRNASAASIVRYISPAERRAAIRRLSTIGVETDALAEALNSGTPGSNRNVLQLMAAGKPLLMVDDDVRWTTWTEGGGDLAPAFVQGAGAAETNFCSTRAEASSGACPLASDVLAAHETLLGKSATSLFIGGADLGRACRYVLRGLASALPFRVRLTQAGVAGDAGWQCAYPLLLAETATGIALRTDADRLARALQRREVRRVASRPTLTRDASCMTFCTAIDNTEMAPPFIPIGRNEDGVFGAALAVADRRALFGHLPLGIVHDSQRPAARRIDDIPSATETRFADLVLAIVEMAAAPPVPQTVLLGLRRIARLARETATLPEAEFVEFVTQVFLKTKCQTIARLEALLSQSCDEHWRMTAERYREALLATVVRPDLCRVTEFSALPTHEAVRACARTLSRWGQIVDVWDQMWEHARQRNDDLFVDDSISRDARASTSQWRSLRR